MGGGKVFRDLVYENRGLMRADHHFYQDHGMYDFPQYKLGKRLFMGLILVCKRIPFLRRRLLKVLLKGKMRPYLEITESSAGS